MHQPGAGESTDLDELVTEQRRPELRDLDLRSTFALVQLMAADQTRVVEAVTAAAGSIAAAVDAVAVQLRRGGRIIYVGAGTAGRLGLLDAAECPPTFNTDRVLGILAGGNGAFVSSHEAGEDDARKGVADIDRLTVSDTDAVVGVTASGRTPYTISAVDHARRRGAVTVGVVCNPGAELSRHVDHPIEVVVGPEVIAGSTRLLAGSAQKFVLNTMSTLAMVRVGKTYGDLMVDMRATNGKLRHRARRIVADATGADKIAVDQALTASDGDVKTAIVMILARVDSQTAGRRLARHDGVVRSALEAEA